MDYHAIYQDYYQKIPSDIKAYKQGNKRLVFGYTSDLDVLISWDNDTFNRILEEHLEAEPAVKKFETIDSMSDFARIVSYYLIHGWGGEIEITNNLVCETLEDLFDIDFALGGTCAQGSTALGTVGFPSVVHITDRSKEVSRLMDGLGIEVVSQNGKVPIIEGATQDLPVRHMILQYPKDSKIIINQNLYFAPVSNRMIMDYDKVHKYVPIDPDFLTYCEKNAENILAYSSSGFNAVVDPVIMKDKADQLSAHYKKIRDANPECMIYFESAHYMNQDVNDMVFERLADSIDLLGLNEEELVHHSQRHGLDTDKDDPVSVIEALNFVMEKYEVTGIVLHTKDYAMYYGHDQPGVDFIKGLTLGNLMAGTRARIGKYGTYEECGETLAQPISPTGVAFAEALEHIETKFNAYLVPSRYMPQPTFTIGLGDTFVAGFMTSFIN